MADHTKDLGKYGGPKDYTADLGKNGYPNNVANTQTQKMRGTGAATKGTGFSKNSN